MESARDKFLWITVTAVISMLVGGFGTIVVTKYLEKQPVLHYYTNTISLVDKTKVTTVRYSIDIINEGETLIEDIDGMISAGLRTEIMDYKTNINNTIMPVCILTEDKEEINIHIPNLNPKERVVVTIDVRGINLPDQPLVFIRGKGVVGKAGHQSHN